jgi:hypothetical protein
MAPFRDNVSEILRSLRRCLGRSNGALGPLLLDSTKKMLLLFHPTRDMSALWRRRLTAIATSILDFGWVVIIYLMSEIIIWGLSRALALAHLEFFSSIFGMALTFVLMAVAYLCSPCVDEMYHKHIKAKVRSTPELQRHWPYICRR